jgi:excisionase family DNA binding protein
MEQQQTQQRVMQAIERKLLTPGEVARILRVDPKTVTRWATQGRIQSVRTPGGHRRFYAAEIMGIAEGGIPWAKKLHASTAS